MRRSVMRTAAAAVVAALPFARVFVINLNSRPARWRSIVHQLTVRAGLPTSCIERVPAIDGNHIARAHALGQTRGLVSVLGCKRLQERPERRIWGMDLNPAALGCALTHLKLWSLITALAHYHKLQQQQQQQQQHRDVQEGEQVKEHANGPVYLIVEDDSLFPPDFLAAYAARLRHVPQDWEMLYLSGLDTSHACPALAVAEGVSRVPQLHRTTNCYAVTAAGAAALLRQCLPLTFQLDTMMTRRVTSNNKSGAEPYVHTPCSYTLQPPLVVQATRFGSDIQTSTADRAGGEDIQQKEQEEAARCRAAGWSAVPE